MPWDCARSGEDRAREQGTEQGIERGIEQGRADLLLKQLRLKFGDLPDEVRSRVRRASADDLDRWAAHVLTAGSLDDVLT